MSITIKNLHSELPEANLHEAKGFTTASNNTYLKKNHEGSSEWLSEYWLQPVNGVVTGSSAPPSESSGNRFILTGSSFHSDWDSPSQHEIVEFNGTSWVGQAAVDGMRVVTLDGDSVYYFNTAWNQVTDANTDTTYAISAVDSGSDAIIRLTAGGSGSGTDDVTLVAGSNITITPSGDDITIAASGGGTYTAGDGLDVSANEFSIDAKSNGGLVIESTELAVDLGASSITGTLAVSDGGTGATTLTANGVLIGNGTSAIASVDMSTKGHILIGDGSGNPQMLAIGSDDQVLTADSGEATGVKWAAAGGGGATALDGLSDCRTPATENYGIGTSALDSITSGDDNIGIGINAGTAITTHSRNIFIGSYSGAAYAGDSGAIGVGYMALTAVTSGQGNLGIGYSAGASTDVWHYNTYIGYQAGRQINQAGNTAIGYQALEGGTSAAGARYNTALGYNSLTAITTGDDNTAIGFQAGDGVTTGSSNTIVGYTADVSGTADNQLAIGNGAVTDGANKIRLGNASISACNIQTDWTIDSDE